MSTKEQWKQNAQIEKEKLKNMSFRDKIWYIGEYYKFHMIGVLVFIGILFVIGNSIYRSTFSTELYCMYVNNRSAEELNTEILEKDFHTYMNFNDKQLISTESTFLSQGSDASELNYATMAKLSALIASKELDIMINDQENFNHYSSMGGFSDMEETLPADVLELVKDRLLYAVDDTGVSHAYGISLDNTKFIADSNISMDSAIFCMISNSTRKENSIALLRYIFAQ